MLSGQGQFRTQSRQQVSSKSVQPDLAATVQQLLIEDEGRVSGGPAGCRAARMVRWKARGWVTATG